MSELEQLCRDTANVLNPLYTLEEGYSLWLSANPECMTIELKRKRWNEEASAPYQETLAEWSPPANGEVGEWNVNPQATCSKDQRWVAFDAPIWEILEWTKYDTYRVAIDELANHLRKLYEAAQDAWYWGTNESHRIL